MAATLRATRADLLEAAQTPQLGVDFADTSLAAVGRMTPFDGYCLLGLDPLSGMRSFMFSRNGLDGVADRLAYNETVEVDAHRYRDLARAELPAGVLSQNSPVGCDSPRLHDILRPAGFSSELRLALRSHGRALGALVLFRSDRRRPFTDRDAATAAAIAEPLTLAVRRYPLRSEPSAPVPLPPGIILLDANNAIAGQNAEAAAWLEDLRPGGDDELTQGDVSRVVYDVGLAARRPRAGLGPPVCRLRTTSGRWLLVQASRVDSDPELVAVVLQAPAARQLLPVVGDLLGLTRRQFDVLGLVAAGEPAQRIARALGLSVLTVNDHLGAIYRKARVSGREELLARFS